MRTDSHGPSTERLLDAAPPVWAGKGQRSPLVGLYAMVRRHPLGIASLAVVAALTLAAFAGPALLPYGPYESDYHAILAPPSPGHPLGTDEIGRDVLARVLAAAQISLQVGILSVVLGTAFGTIAGIVSGFLGGITDLLMQRAIEILMAFPALILAMAVVSVLGPDLRNTLVAIAIVFIPYSARTVRGAVLSVKQSAYVEAARVLGCGDLRILARHIAPNVMAPIIVIASVQLANAIIVEASLSFLGLGTQPPDASLGTMLSQAVKNPARITPWLVYGPGMMIGLLVLAVNLAGDTLRDVLDPRLRGR